MNDLESSCKWNNLSLLFIKTKVWGYTEKDPEGSQPHLEVVTLSKGSKDVAEEGKVYVIKIFTFYLILKLIEKKRNELYHVAFSVVNRDTFLN